MVCPGAYSEDVGGFMRCYFKADPKILTRVPWRLTAKSEAELAVESSFQPTIVESGAADIFEGLDLSSMPGKKAAAERLLNIAREKGVNVPEVEQEAKVRFGSLIMNNPDKSSNDLLSLAEQMFGTKVATTAKSETSKAGTVCADNARCVIYA